MVSAVTGAVIGALIMGVLNMGLSIMGTDAAFQQVFKGPGADRRGRLRHLDQEAVELHAVGSDPP